LNVLLRIPDNLNGCPGVVSAPVVLGPEDLRLTQQAGVDGHLTLQHHFPAHGSAEVRATCIARYAFSCDKIL
jgi:hypothetical protein